MTAKCALFLLFIATSVKGAGAQGQAQNYSFISTAGGYAVLAVAGLIGCAVISLCAWICCGIHEKYCVKNKVGHGPKRTGPQMVPPWSRNLIMLQELSGRGFGESSSGMAIQTHFNVTRQGRSGSTDGARWNTPLPPGRHVFEVTWLWGQRGKHSCVGVATDKATLKHKKGKNIVGADSETWGLAIVKRKVRHEGRTYGGHCPPDGSYVPDRFLMYVDTIDGMLGFGTEVTFWGYLLTNLPKVPNRALYVMVSTDATQADIKVHYKGSADPNAPVIPQTTITPYAMQAPGPGVSPYGMPAGQPQGIPGPPNYLAVAPAGSKGVYPGPPPTPHMGHPAYPPTTAPPPYTSGGYGNM